MLSCGAIFTDHMVLMRDARVCIWGKCCGSDTVTVSIDNIRTTARVTNDCWRVYLPCHRAGGPYTLKVETADEALEFCDVVYGEVFLAAGQSNMEMALIDSQDGTAEAMEADYPELRYYNVYKTGYIDASIVREINGVKWEKCQGKASENISAVAYFAGRKIHKELGVPVGIIDCYQGGTSISSWLPDEILERYTIGRKCISDYAALVGDKTDEEYDRQVEEYWRSWHAWDDKVKDIKSREPKAAWEDIVAYAGECPWPQPAGRKSVFRPSGCYDTMLKQIAPYTMSGIFYYQGETDAENAEFYYDLMQVFIAHIRELFQNRELYFVITQLPMFGEKGAKEDYTWAVMRENQLRIYENIRNVGLLSLADLGELGNIHPTDKKTPGERLGDLVLQERFHRGNKGRAMLPLDITSENGEIIITLKNTYGKVWVKENSDLDYPAAFEVAEDDGEFYPCDFKVDGDRIILITDSGMNLQRVRYGWRNYCQINIFNNAGIPLVPFGERKVH